MNINTALAILKLSESANPTDIKKKYRSLMQLVHPDAQAFTALDKKVYEYEAHEINAAYEYLCSIEYDGSAYSKTERKPGVSFKKKEKTQNSKAQDGGWNAAINEAAYTEREVYQYIEDAAGNQHGQYTAAKGKYIWNKDEDFKLFLLSIYNCSKKLLEHIRPEISVKYLGELAYLLAQQFIASEDVLNRYKVEGETEPVYHIPSMLETEGKRCMLKEGTVLYPSGIRNHRLYLMDKNKKEIGYLSFVDDRLYYAVVPLFEQRRVQVKINLAGSTTGNNNRRGIKVRNIDLWIKYVSVDVQQIIISISDKIKETIHNAEKEN